MFAMLTVLAVSVLVVPVLVMPMMAMLYVVALSVSGMHLVAQFSTMLFLMPVSGIQFTFDRRLTSGTGWRW